jgi:hypothetical protein
MPLVAWSVQRAPVQTRCSHCDLLQGVSLKDFVSEDADLSVAQLCSNEVTCMLNTAISPSKVSFDLTVAGDASLSDEDAARAVVAQCSHEALKQPAHARSMSLFALLRVRARRRAGDRAFRRHWFRMRMKAVSVLVNTERVATFSATPAAPPAAQTCFESLLACCARVRDTFSTGNILSNVLVCLAPFTFALSQQLPLFSTS